MKLGSLSTAGILSLSLLTAGCGEWGGGASVVPSVTFLPADLSGDAGTEVAVETDSGAESQSSGGMGSIKGRVLLTGAAPDLPPLIAKGAAVKDAEVCAAVNIPDERLMLGADNGVANVFVYVPKKPKGVPSPADGEDMIFDQKNCRFLPHALVVPTSRTVRVLSDDPIAHNTHSFPKKNQGVNSGVAPNDREGILQINYNRAEAEPLQVKCDYHAWMIAYHLPVDHHIAAVTDADGNFEIKDVPSGDYSFNVWHEAADGKYVARKLKVTVKGGDPTPLEISYPADKLKL